MSQNEGNTTEQQALQPQEKREIVRPVIIDDGEFSNFMDTNRFEHMWRVATVFAKTELVPTHYQGKPENCMIAIEMAMRLGMAPLPFLQNTYIVHGRPGIEAKLAISLINSSGLFVDPLDYEVSGEDPKKPDYKVRAFAVRKSTKKTIHGPWVTWDIVKGEGWDKKTGSKWMTMPALMFAYRAAMFFGRLHCPERLLGMQTVEELHDIDRREIELNPEERGYYEAQERAATLEEQVGLKKDAGKKQEKKKEKKQEEKAQPEAAQDTEAKLSGPRLALRDTLADHCKGDEGEMVAYLAATIGRKMDISEFSGLTDEDAGKYLNAVKEQIQVDADFAGGKK